MAVENWIDEIARLFEISDGKGGTIRSYRVYEKSDFPEAINTYPCALTFTTEIECHDGSGAQYDLWQGITEFHLYDGVDKSKYPYIMLFFDRICKAAVGNVTLTGKVSYFKLRSDNGPSIVGPATLQYGSENPHLGLVVYWIVKENVTRIIA